MPEGALVLTNARCWLRCCLSLLAPGAFLSWFSEDLDSSPAAPYPARGEKDRSLFSPSPMAALCRAPADGKVDDHRPMLRRTGTVDQSHEMRIEDSPRKIDLTLHTWSVKIGSILHPLTGSEESHCSSKPGVAVY